MGLLQNLTNRVFGTNDKSSDKQKLQNAFLRQCYFEVMEQRRVLSADPVVAGITYVEGDLGQDNTPDHFELTFEGGAATTQLTQFTINGDQDQNGVTSDGDMFFDIAPGLPGTSGSAAFQFDATHSVGLTAADVLGVTISDDGLTMTVDLANFEAGDKLAFTIDVDEQERFKVDKIASGVEYEGTFFDAKFTDDNYTFEELSVNANEPLEGGIIQQQQEGIFYDEYDNLLAEGERLANGDLDLSFDNENGQQNRSAASLDAYELVEKPIMISGTVYHDEDIDCVHDEDEDGISGVEIRLQRLNESTGQYEDVAQTTTDDAGNYMFGKELGLKPGEYQIVQVQPDGYLDVGAAAGQVEGIDSGTVQSDSSSNDNIITGISIPLGGTSATDYDFKEVKPASIQGNVWHDENDDGVFDPDEHGIANVLIQVTRVGAKEGVTSDPFAATAPIFVRTDANGHYSVDALPPGIYEVVEINNDPAGGNPLSEYVDGKDSTGNVRGTTVGTKTNDKFSQIELCADDHGVEYNFGELRPASISGYVSVETPGQGKLDPTDPNFQPIAGVTMQLLDADGNLLDTTTTDETGNYSFDGLAPGNYTVVEVQPNGYLDAGEAVGNVDGQSNGLILANDRISNIQLGSGDQGTRYDFCEHLPASIKGTVYHDRNDNGVQDDGEEGIGGVLIQLFDNNGNVVQETRTDAQGDYCFEDLIAGTYKIVESQPATFNDGKDTLGTVAGADGSTTPSGFVEADAFCDIVLEGGDQGTEYNFGELRLASVKGTVFHDVNNDGVQDSGEEGIANVLIQLFDADGNLVQETRTDAQGDYCFEDLAPGEYKIRETQPTAYLDGIDTLGTVDGTARGEFGDNDVFCVKLESGDAGVNYDFGEYLPAEIHGRVWEDGPVFQTEDGTLPDDYRDQRDAVYQEGVDTPLEGVRMQLYYYIDNVTQEIAPRPVTLSEVDASYYDHMGTNDPNAPVWVDTMADGQYWFQGLQPGNYIVLETQPDGYTDSNDVVGSTTGAVYNSDVEAATAPQTLTRTFSTEQIRDAVVNIRVNAGGVSVANNFSEVRVQQLPGNPVTPQLPPDNPTNPPGNPLTPRPGITGFPGLFGSQPSAFTQFVGTSRGASFQTQAAAAEPYSWHLSVVNGGLPRAVGQGNAVEGDSIFQQAGYIDSNDWNRFDMTAGTWTFTETSEVDGQIASVNRSAQFGMVGGIPLAGDFDGDGRDEVAVFMDGYWMIDVNRTGAWDETDLLAKLGDSEDRPVVGDWDGDGKDDIGIYGPMWERDPEAIEREPGLPNPDNDPFTKPKNVPPMVGHDATNGARILKLTSHGQQRADVVDHVFGIDDGEKVPVTGDWNGNGIRSIGTFEGGLWRMDVNGDGQFDHRDGSARFGQAGDIPLVGDFDGDGVEQIAVYRNGTWLIDSNGNRELDATDKTFQMGGAGDKPVVGDWDGDGVDEPALYTDGQSVIGETL